MLIKNIANLVDFRVKERGMDYYARGKVALTETGANQIRAIVTSGDPYSVTIMRSGVELNASCPCPTAYFDSRICKHIWATLLACEHHGELDADVSSPSTIRVMEVAELHRKMDSEALADADDEEDQASYNKILYLNSRRMPPARPARNAEPAKWRSLLSGSLPAADDGLKYGQANALSYSRTLYYAVMPHKEGEVLVQVCCRDLRLAGTAGKLKPARISSSIFDAADASEQELLELLAETAQEDTYSVSYSYYNDGHSGRGNVPSTLLPVVIPRLCATGRCGYCKKDDLETFKRVQWDETEWEFRLEIAAKGSAYALRGFLVGGSAGERIELAEIECVGTLLLRQDKLARLRDAGCPDLLKMLKASKGFLDIPKNQLPDFLEELAKAKQLPPIQIEPGVPIQCSSGLTGQKLVIEGQMGSKLGASAVFEYAGRQVAGRSLAAAYYDRGAGTLVLRDREKELQALRAMESTGFRQSAIRHPSGSPWKIAEKAWAEALPKLAADWQIESNGKTLLAAASFDLKVVSGIDWFDLEACADFGGGKKVGLPALLAALGRGEKTVALDGGEVGVLPEKWLSEMAGLAALGKSSGQQVRFRTCQAALLDALLCSQPQARCDEVFEKMRKRLSSFAGIQAADAPAAFKGELRAYQRDGLGWMLFLREFGLGGCLADDMGLGKTIQVLALLLERLTTRPACERAPSLVVVPKSLLGNWTAEAARFAPELKVLALAGAGRHEQYAEIAAADLVLITYATARLDAARLKDIAFDYIILDEAQCIKNAGTDQAKAMRLLNGRHRLALSGTPVENRLSDLWSIFEFLNPGMLGGARVFAELGKTGSAESASQSILARAMRPFILRRTKQQVASDLPEKTEQTVFCELEPEQRGLYNELRDHYRAKLLNGTKAANKIQVLEALLRLRQAACHPGLIDKKLHQQPSAKLEWLLDQIEEVTAGGHKALVFSQFTSFLKLVQPALQERGIPFEYLDGATRDRDACVQRFQSDPDCKLFLISLKAGGVGLNLTAAEYVFLLDPWWNPAVEAQAIDRAHRIGQKCSVFAYRIIARETVEEKVLQLQAQKRALADAIIGEDNSVIGGMSRSELELLLS